MSLRMMAPSALPLLSFPLLLGNLERVVSLRRCRCRLRNLTVTDLLRPTCTASVGSPKTTCRHVHLRSVPSRAATLYPGSYDAHRCAAFLSPWAD